MKAPLYVASRSPSDWQDRLAEPDRHWRNGFSAKSAALSWELSKGLPSEIQTLFGADAKLLLGLVEHKVALPGPGHASQNDVFAFLSTSRGPVAVAVEAKVNEPFDKTLAEWLSPESAGKESRLRGLCEILERPFPPPSNLRYQLFHRTASAILEARRFGMKHAAMVVQSFSAEHRWFDDFADFANWLGMPTSIGHLSSRLLSDGLTLQLGWAHANFPEDHDV